MHAVGQGLEVADVYAAALFALAAEANQLDVVRDELAGLAEMQTADPQFAAFLTSAAIDAGVRKQSLERMFRGRLSDIVLNTLQIMNLHGRVGLLPQLDRAFVLRLEDARGQVEVTATSAVELSPQQRDEVARVAEELAGRKPIVQYEVDADLLGGLVLRIGDHLFDNSLRTRLRAMRSRLHERSARGLEIGTETRP